MISDKIILQVALNIPLRRLYDYEAPRRERGDFYPGKRVLVPFGKKERIGIVLSQREQSDIPQDQLKRIKELIDPYPLFPANWLDFVSKTANYYHHAIGEVAFTGLPPHIRQGKPCEQLDRVPFTSMTTSDLTLNDEQQVAVQSILAQPGFQPFLLDGITGSGKTEVYLTVCQRILAQQKQVLILVPEISLTPQTEQRFKARFGQQIVCYHSKMTAQARYKAWLKVRHQAANVVIGTRSAIFLPFTHLGLIVCDEEHDPSFKQQEGFRYSARDCAVLRAKLEQCPVILGSATPAFESYYHAQTEKYTHLRLKARATQSQLPQITLLDVRHKKLAGGLAAQTLDSIEQEIAKEGQVLLFINRRGYAPILMCYACGWLAECERCDTRLTYHYQQRKLICHHCLHQKIVPSRCPSCQNGELNPLGHGTERLEEVLQGKFPQLNIARIDSDVTRVSGSLERLLQQAQQKDIQLLIGTQILAKGHHFPHLSLVVILDADGGLFSVDFRAVERMAQLLIQVAGRAGRVHQAGKVILQTFHPEHPLLNQMLKQDYHQLADSLLKERARCQLPPFAHFALIRAQAQQPLLGHSLLQELQVSLSTASTEVSVLGPIPAPMLKRQGYYRYQLLLQSTHRKPLHQALSYTTSILEKSKLAKRVRWSLDVDPVEMF